LGVGLSKEGRAGGRAQKPAAGDSLDELTEDVCLRLFGWPRYSDRAQQRAVGPSGPVVIGVRYDLGNGIGRGARQGPTSVRAASAGCARPRGLGMDAGDLVQVDGEDPAETFERLGRAVDAIVASGNLPVILGGDHSVSYPVVERLQRRERLAVVWLDAHTDFSPWLGDHPPSHKQVLRAIHGLSGVARVVQVGYRGFTIDDERHLDEKVKVLRVTDVRADPAGRLLLRCVPRDLPCYVSVDIDVLDPAVTPGTCTPVPGGLWLEEVASLVGALVRRRRVVGLDLVEVNPRWDGAASSTSVSGCRVLGCLLGGSI
jgi:agmatinase